VRPASLKWTFGTRVPILISTRPRSTIVRTGGGTFGCPAKGPPRHVRSWKPSATDGRVPKNMSSSRRMYSRSCGVKGQGAGFMRPVMTPLYAGPTAAPMAIKPPGRPAQPIMRPSRRDSPGRDTGRGRPARPTACGDHCPSAPRRMALVPRPQPVHHRHGLAQRALTDVVDSIRNVRIAGSRARIAPRRADARTRGLREVEHRYHRAAQRLGAADRRVFGQFGEGHAVSLTVASDDTSQCETSSDRAPA
jgi:hypothetical protein